MFIVRIRRNRKTHPGQDKRDGKVPNGDKEIEHASVAEEALSEWRSRSDRKSKLAHWVKDKLVSEVRQKAQANVSFAKAMVALAPLLGLLGTVTGMVTVFDNMAITDGADAKALSRGVSQATIPTMAGMLVRAGFVQGVIPPLERPNICFLEDVGFRGSPAEQIERVAKTAPRLLKVAYSASSMWTANAATISPSADTIDGRLHLTPANLSSMLHRSLEPEDTHV